MKYLAFLCLLSAGLGADIDSKICSKIVDSIYVIEGKNKTKYPYGIKSIPIKGNSPEKREKYARRICENTVKNNWKRWELSGKKNKFFEFLAAKYCPVNDPHDKNGLNKHWLGNLKSVSKLDI